MKRWPIVASFLLFVAVCASAAYWGMQLFAPRPRPVAAPPAAQSDTLPRLETAAGLFGGRPAAPAATSNFQLKGVVMAGRPSESVAILVVNGKPPQAFRANAEILPGITIREIHRRHVLLSSEGRLTRVDLPAEAAAQSGRGPAQARAPVQMAPAQPPAMAATPDAAVDGETNPAEQASSGIPGDTRAGESAREQQDPAVQQNNPPRR